MPATDIQAVDAQERGEAGESGCESAADAGVKPSFQGEVMLAGWKEAHTSGATVTFFLPDAEDLGVFRGMTVKKGNTAGQRFMCVLVEIGDDERPVAKPTLWDTDCPGFVPPPERRPPNELARDLFVMGYFYNRNLWARMDESGFYTQAMHKAWVMRQTCYGARWQRQIRCSGDIIAHHADVASEPAAGSGKHPQKPADWITVPLCHGHHAEWAHGSWSQSATREDKARMHKAAIDMTAEQMKVAMKRWLKIESLAEITHDMVRTFEANFNL